MVQKTQKTEQNSANSLCMGATRGWPRGNRGKRGREKSCGYLTFRPIGMRRNCQLSCDHCRGPQEAMELSLCFCLLPRSLPTPPPHPPPRALPSRQGYYPQKECCFSFQAVLVTETARVYEINPSLQDCKVSPGARGAPFCWISGGALGLLAQT